MNWLDWALVLAIGFSVLSGFSAGFSRVVVGLIATITGIFVALWCYRFVAAQILDYIKSREAANLIGFVLIYITVAVLGGIVARLLAGAFKWAGLSWLDRLMGAGVGFVRGVLIAVAVVAVILAFAPADPPSALANSRLLPYLSHASTVLVAATPYEVKQGYNETKQKVRKLWDQQVHTLSKL